MSALKNKDLGDTELKAVIASMKQLNRVPELISEINVHAATDVTGFGLAGHLLQMMRASGVRAEIELKSLPLLPGTQQCLEKKILNRAHRTNWEYVQNEIQPKGLTEFFQHVITDPQTSGGLLLAARKEDADLIVEKLKTQFPSTVIIGRVHGATGVHGAGAPGAPGAPGVPGADGVIDAKLISFF